MWVEDRVVNRSQFFSFLANRPQIELQHEAAVLKLKREVDNSAGAPLNDAVELAKLRAEKAVLTTQVPNEVVADCCKAESVSF